MHGNMVFSRDSIFPTPQQSGCLCVCTVQRQQRQVVRFSVNKMRSHCGMEGGGNVVPVRGQHEGKGSVLPGRIPHL